MTTTYFGLSDLHAGSTMAGCPKAVQLDDGGYYEPSLIQEHINERLRQFAAACAEARKDKCVLALNGDLLDGQVKGSAQVASAHPHTEFAILKDILEPFVALRPDAVIVTRGTEAHVGKSGNKDEAAAHYLAKECGLNVLRDPNTRRYSVWQHESRPEGHLVYIRHHGPAGKKKRSNTLVLAAFDEWVERVSEGLEPPKVVLQGHNHLFGDTWWIHPTRLVQQGPWQLKNEYAWKVAAPAVNILGGVIMQFEKDTLPEVTMHKYHPDPSVPWVP